MMPNLLNFRANYGNYTHIVQFLPKGSNWVVLFGFSFLGPLLQRSPWTDHLLWGQIRESCSYNKTQNLARTIFNSIEASVAQHTVEY